MSSSFVPQTVMPTRPAAIGEAGHLSHHQGLQDAVAEVRAGLTQGLVDVAVDLTGKSPTKHTHAASDVVSGVLAPARLGTGTPVAGAYVDGGTGAWTPLPTSPGGSAGPGMMRAVTPETYGVVGDGATDNTAAWPAVIAAAAAAGLPIYLAPDKAYMGLIRAVDCSLNMFGGGRLIVPASKASGGLTVLHAPGPAVTVSSVANQVVGPVTGKPSPPETETASALSVAWSNLSKFKADDTWRIQAAEIYDWSGNPGIPDPKKVWKAAMFPVAGVLLPYTADTTAVKEGDTITGVTSGATALVGSVFAGAQIVAKWVTGTFTAGESLTVGGNAVGSLTGSPSVLMKGVLDDTYSTSVTVRKLRSDLTVSLRDITIDTMGDPDTIVGTANRPSAVSIVGCVAPEVTGVTIRNAWATGVAVISCMRPYVRVRVLRAANNATTGGSSSAASEQGYGYGVEVLGSTEHGDFIVHASSVRHGFTTNPTCYNTRPVVGVGTATEGSELLLGTCKRNVVHDSTVSNSWAAGFDTHDGAYHTMFRNCVAIGSHAAYRYYSASVGFNNRGFSTTYENCRAVGSLRGFVDLTGIDTATVTSVARYINCFAEDYQYLGFDIRNASGGPAKRLEMVGCRARGRALGTTPYASVGFSIGPIDAIIRGCVSERFSGAPAAFTTGGGTYPVNIVLDNFTSDYSECTDSGLTGVRIGGSSLQTLTVVGAIRVLTKGSATPPSSVSITGGSPTVRFTEDPVVVNADGVTVPKCIVAAGATPTVKRVTGYVRPVEWSDTAPSQPLTGDAWGKTGTGSGGGVSVFDGTGWVSTGPLSVAHGATASTTRPSTSGAVTWYGSVAPSNWVGGDLWVNGSTVSARLADGDTANLTSWYRASDAGFSDGAAPASWPNRVSGSPALAFTGGPTYTASGTPRVVFDGVDDYASESTTASAATGTIVLVARLVAAGSNRVLTSAPTGTRGLFTSSSGKWSMTAGTSVYGATADTGWHFFAFAATGTDSSLLVVDGSVITADAGANPAAGLKLAVNMAGTTFTAMEIAEVRLFGGPKSAAQLADLRTTLKAWYPSLP